MEDFKDELQETFTEKSNISVKDVGEKLDEMYDKLQEGIDSAFSATAEKIDYAAESIHQSADSIHGSADYLGNTAQVIRSKNYNVIRNDFINTIKKYPLQALSGALAVGFIIGKLFK